MCRYAPCAGRLCMCRYAPCAGRLCMCRYALCVQVCSVCVCVCVCMQVDFVCAGMLCIYIHIVVRTNSCRNMVLRGCGRL